MFRSDDYDEYVVVSFLVSFGLFSTALLYVWTLIWSSSVPAPPRIASFRSKIATTFALRLAWLGLVLSNVAPKPKANEDVYQHPHTLVSGTNRLAQLVQFNAMMSASFFIVDARVSCSLPDRRRDVRW